MNNLVKETLPQPVMKLQQKTTYGSKVKKTCDRPTTPFQHPFTASVLIKTFPTTPTVNSWIGTLN